MGKDKLRRFSENLTFKCFVQPEFDDIFRCDHPLKGHWQRDFFHNDHPIVLELGCGKGEYTVALAEREPGRNFIGIDIKGARMWRGAKTVTERGMTNAAFLRTRIEFIDHLFGEGEVSEIWITFPDPQMKKVRKRLTSTRFMALYQQILTPDGLIHLKSDSPFMYTYTCEMVKANGYPVQVATDDLYHSGIADDILEIKTFYEQQWLERGMNIKYIRFVCQPREQFVEPDVDIPYDTYRSFNRGKRSGKQSSQDDTTTK